MKTSDLGVRVGVEKTFNLGNYQSKKIILELQGSLEVVKEYQDIEKLLAKVIKNMEYTVDRLKEKKEEE